MALTGGAVEAQAVTVDRPEQPARSPDEAILPPERHADATITFVAAAVDAADMRTRVSLADCLAMTSYAWLTSASHPTPHGRRNRAGNWTAGFPDAVRIGHPGRRSTGSKRQGQRWSFVRYGGGKVVGS